jgi:hypothetical protein
MTTIEVKPNLQIEVKEVLNGVAKLNTKELETFMNQVAQLLAKRKAKSLSHRESELLLKINVGYPPDMKNRFEILNAKMRASTISPEEQQELIEISDIFEAMDAQRLEFLLELAHLRGLTLDHLLGQLGLNSFPAANA